jgi:signal transduction histidine kinase
VETLRVLVTDDELGMLKAVERVLRDFTVQLDDVDREVRFETETAGSGEEAVERVTASRPDILLLDYKLPGMNGLDVLEALRPLTNGEMLTIMMTAYASLETAVTATKRGAYDFLAKPFTPDELKGTIRKAAGHLILTQQARRLAAEKRQVRFQFISVLAHELKAPIGAVEGYLRMLRDRTAGDDPAVYEKMLARCLVRMSGMRKLIFDLLDLTRIESGQKKRDIRQVDVRDIAETAIESFTPEADERGIAVAIHAEPSVPMAGDAGELEIVLNNLVSNAVKYNRDSGKVDVSIARDADTVTLRVSDTGIGMSREEAARLFNDFVRIKNARTKDILGSGLGLSTLKKLAKLYGGDVSVESEPDVGTTFTVVLRDAEEPVRDAE